jgi:hypothetical protein
MTSKATAGCVLTHGAFTSISNPKVQMIKLTLTFIRGNLSPQIWETFLFFEKANHPTWVILLSTRHKKDPSEGGLVD